jgi:FixJ family two-component response regulator
VILLIDDDLDLREGIIDLYAAEGYDCLGAASFEDLLEHADKILQARLAILDVNLGAERPSGVEVYRWLKRRNFSGQVVFLTGHAAGHPLVEQVHKIEGAQVLTKPIAAEKLVDLALAANRAGERDP